VLAGHLHPTAVLYGGGRDALRMPCFVAEPGLLVLPAFGEFTGGHAVPAAPGRQRFAVGAGRVWALP
jgi:metallophosphoesterase superfamily enzyme